ncbi:hypothetical protein [Halorubrum ezzemoulense]|uniref:Uncharacterized protein n=1 Tax=Halorubrum ezzemoulense TaxID=337243 RepID=A0A256JRR7_HALEZ|nr:hypothetical protein [Halorubrum ezzemoulense]OYR71584.1 hypothetical protein DJ78_05055 [Halorubrum ezzemoulense]
MSDPRPSDLADRMDDWFADRDGQDVPESIEGADDRSAPLEFADDDVAIYRDIGAGVLERWAESADMDFDELDDIMSRMRDQHQPDAEGWIMASPVVFKRRRA